MGLQRLSGRNLSLFYASTSWKLGVFRRAGAQLLVITHRLKVFWLFSQTPDWFVTVSFQQGAKHLPRRPRWGARSLCRLLLRSFPGPPSRAKGEQSLGVPASRGQLLLSSRENYFFQALPSSTPLPRAGSILGKISARGEVRELFSREHGGRLLFAGSGKGDHWKLRGRCSWSCDPAAQPGVGRVWRERRESWAGRQPRAPERAPALRSVSPAVGEARPAAAADRGRARARASSGSPQPHLRGRPAQGSPPGRAGYEVRGSGCGCRRGPARATSSPRGHRWKMSQERPTFYRQELNKTIWEVPERYQNLSPVGSGAYGSVWWVSPGRGPRWAGCLRMPQSQACPHGSAMHPAAGIFRGGRASQPSSTPVLHSLSPLHPHPARPRRWSAVCRTQVGCGLWAVGAGVGAGPWLAFPWGWGVGAVLLRGQEQGSLFGDLSLLASSRRTLSRCACPRSRQARGAARRSRRAKLDCGHLNKTEDEGRWVRAFLQTSVEIAFWEGFLLNSHLN